MKYIDAEKLIAEIKIIQQSLESRDVRLNQVKKIRTECMIEFCKSILEVIASLQQEPSEGVQGTIHHCGEIVHYIVPNQEQLNARLIQFPNDAEVEIFIEARKEDTK